MGIIRVLEDQTVHQIAAGEVVERPAHLVKELVENALDAGASEIDVEIDQGGRWVQVSDNGRGMSPEDVPLALHPHATSKIHDFKDLFALTTFGFRGEALASIAAVSRLTLDSRSADDSTGTRLVSDYGALSAPVSVSRPVGTTVAVEALFENVPARLKFMRSESAETTQIKITLRAMALVRHDVTFRIRSQGKIIEFWPATDSPRTRAERLLGVEGLFEAHQDQDSWQCHVVFSSPSHVGKTNRGIHVFVQDRWVQDRALQAAVMDAYRSLLMHGEYPYVVVRVSGPPDEVDANVHPTKSQVKFKDSSRVFRLVHGTLRSALEKAPWRPAISNGEPSSYAGPSSVAEGAQSETARLGHGHSRSSEAGFAVAPAFAPLLSSAPEFFVRSSRRVELPESTASQEPLLHVSPPAAPAASGETFPSMVPGGPQGATPSEDAKASSFWSCLEVLGQAHLTYILAQSDDALWLVDQHAAHERVNFEKLMGGFRQGRVDVQRYLLPLNLDFTADQMEALLLQQQDLSRLGVEVEAAGPTTLAINTRPIMMDDGGVVAAVVQLAEELVQRGGSFAFEKRVGDLIATMACHSSVRAGQALSLAQMRELLRDMDAFPLSTFCPHGRPVHLQFPFSRLERDFGRTV